MPPAGGRLRRPGGLDPPAPRRAVFAQLDAAAGRLRAGITAAAVRLDGGRQGQHRLRGRPHDRRLPRLRLHAGQPPPRRSQRLCDAGAVVLGKTNLDQFATGLVGTRSPYGACRNVYNPAYISGGSSSGSAVAVAAGLADVALGTDTAGSGRVPAAFNNLVGLKPTRGLVSTTGVVPACRSLDCVSVFARTCELAGRVFRATPRLRPGRRLLPPGRGRCRRRPTAAAPHDGLAASASLPTATWSSSATATAERLYRRAIARARSLGGSVVPIDFRPFLEAARLLYEGPWVAERLAAVKELFTRSPESLLPVTRPIIGSAARFSAVDVFEATYRLRALRRRAEAEWERMDVLLLPTTGTIYTLAEVEADPIGLNRNLGYYTNFVNLLDLCALAAAQRLPARRPACRRHPHGPCRRRRPAAGRRLPLRVRDAGRGGRSCRGEGRGGRGSPFRGEVMKLAVVGAHLSGLPLNGQLLDRGATLVRQRSDSAAVRATEAAGRAGAMPESEVR